MAQSLSCFKHIKIYRLCVSFIQETQNPGVGSEECDHHRGSILIFNWVLLQRSSHLSFNSGFHMKSCVVEEGQ